MFKQLPGSALDTPYFRPRAAAQLASYGGVAVDFLEANFDPYDLLVLRTRLQPSLPPDTIVEWESAPAESAQTSQGGEEIKREVNQLDEDFEPLAESSPLPGSQDQGRPTSQLSLENQPMSDFSSDKLRIVLRDVNGQEITMNEAKKQELTDRIKTITSEHPTHVLLDLASEVNMSQSWLRYQLSKLRMPSDYNPILTSEGWLLDLSEYLDPNGVYDDLITATSTILSDLWQTDSNSALATLSTDGWILELNYVQPLVATQIQLLESFLSDRYQRSIVVNVYGDGTTDDIVYVCTTSPPIRVKEEEFKLVRECLSETLLDHYIYLSSISSSNAWSLADSDKMFVCGGSVFLRKEFAASAERLRDELEILASKGLFSMVLNSVDYLLLQELAEIWPIKVIKRAGDLTLIEFEGDVGQPPVDWLDHALNRISIGELPLVTVFETTPLKREFGTYEGLETWRKTRGELIMRPFPLISLPGKLNFVPQANGRLLVDVDLDDRWVDLGETDQPETLTQAWSRGDYLTPYAKEYFLATGKISLTMHS